MNDGGGGTTRDARRCMECGRRIRRGYLCESCDGVTFVADPTDDD